MSTRQPQRIRPRRTAGDVVVGIAALFALAALIGGVPYALLRLAGPPIGPELLELDVLTGQVGTDTVVAILVLLVWLAWFQLLVCVIVEVYAGLRRVGLPARVPLSGGTQALANRLVSAALLLFTASAVAVPLANPGGAAPARPAVAAAAHDTPVASSAQAPATVLREVAKTKKVYVVQPPHGRHHESLWEIAEKCLGDGRRYHEIFELNKNKTQPDGSRLHIADLIRPGWVLDMPKDAVNVHVVPADWSREQIAAAHPGRPAELDGRSEAFEQGKTADDAARERSEPAGPDRPAPREGATGDLREDPREGRAAPGGEERPTGESGPAEEARPATEEPVLGLGEYLMVMSLASAGLLAALGRRRREQLWYRAFGRRVTRPREDAAAAEVEMRFGADAPGARMLDVGLRLLGRALAACGRTPPTIYAAHLSAAGLDLWVHPAQEDVPEPWTAHDGGRVWRLAAHEGRMIDERSVAGAAAPYPGLVSLGVDGAGRLLVDLEAAHGLINIKGAHVPAALAAIAVELATNRWSDRMRITLVGFGEELVAIAPERISVAGGLAEVLPELEARAAAAAGRGDVLTGRVNGRPDDPAWSPHYLLSAVEPTPEEARRLAVLARSAGRMAAGYIVAGDVPHATWTWEITEDGRAVVDALGVEATAQLLPRRQYGALIELFRTAERHEGEPLPMYAAEPLPTRIPPASVEVRILGPIEIDGVDPIEEGRLDLATEMLVYLATHPGGVHPVVLGGVLWPRGVQSDVRDAAIARVAAWLGTDGSGRPHLYTDESGRLRLGPEVRTDWALFQRHLRAAHADPAALPVLLERALSLVRGPLLNGRPRGRYAWLAAEDLEYDVTATVADTAHRLCEIRLAQGDPVRAVAAVRAGLLLAADDEGLWRDLLRATHATGDRARLRAVVEAVHRRAASHPYGGGMAPETEALIDELMPTWRVHAVPSA
ncbi:hypothetical protein [Thermostaphylospora chromogena]|uniref:Transcriptional activator domain-containing protein n=1 Tax=Thermostaphylospora chromogena TaxID=35622 RepID=A0A1H1EEJ7_9ACTN|nr:hypothetical protein [Thermostaphylospora chromogena]SDQ87064.1 transcriptional activator domain-containing protein [Thermostaphylospora chromogena]